MRKAADGKKEEQEKLWSKDLVLILVYKCLTAAVFIALTTILASYSMLTYNSSASEAGLIVGMFVIGSLLSRISLARYIDYLGRRRIMLVSTGAFTVLMAMHLLPMSVPLFIALRFVHGMMFGALANTSVIATAELVPTSRYGEGMGYLGVVINLAGAFGPVVGLNVARAFGYGVVFIVCMVFSAIAFLIIFFINVPEASSYDEKRQSKPSIPKTGLLDAASLPLSLCALLFCIPFSGISAFLDPYTQSLDMAEVASWFFAISAAAAILTRPYYGRLLDRRSDNLMMYQSVALFAISLLLLAVWHHPISFAIAAVASSMGYHNTTSVTLTAVTRGVGSRMSLAMSTYYTLVDTGSGIGPTIMGLVVGFAGYSGMYLIAMVAALLTGVFYIAIHGRTAGKIDRAEENTAQ